MIKVKECFLGILDRGTFVYTLKKLHCVIWKKNGRDALLNGLEEMDRNFK